MAFVLALIGFSVNALFSFPLRVLTPGHIGDELYWFYC
ncbi:MAG: hypothetical protein Rsou_0493 [Candidatus Ruthia sp. Asou_11_S2]|nr:hypothetical protein [Candidatus Ruthia sp. Asou_11_S2]